MTKKLYNLTLKMIKIKRYVRSLLLNLQYRAIFQNICNSKLNKLQKNVFVKYTYSCKQKMQIKSLSKNTYTCNFAKKGMLLFLAVTFLSAKRNGEATFCAFLSR